MVLGIWFITCTITSLSPLHCEFMPCFGNAKKGALDLQSYVMRFVSYLPKVGGFLRVLQFPPPVKLTAMI